MFVGAVEELFVEDALQQVGFFDWAFGSSGSAARVELFMGGAVELFGEEEGGECSLGH